MCRQPPTSACLPTSVRTVAFCCYFLLVAVAPAVFVVTGCIIPPFSFFRATNDRALSRKLGFGLLPVWGRLLLPIIVRQPLLVVMGRPIKTPKVPIWSDRSSPRFCLAFLPQMSCLSLSLCISMYPHGETAPAWSSYCKPATSPHTRDTRMYVRTPPYPRRSSSRTPRKHNNPTKISRQGNRPKRTSTSTTPSSYPSCGASSTSTRVRTVGATRN